LFGANVLGASAALAAAAFTLTESETAVAAQSYVTACTALDICYCVSSDFRDAIDANVARVRQLIAIYKAQGKAIGAERDGAAWLKIGMASQPGRRGRRPHEWGERRRLHVYVDADPRRPQGPR
jgi:hypothetical protein